MEWNDASQNTKYNEMNQAFLSLAILWCWWFETIWIKIRIFCSRCISYKKKEAGCTSRTKHGKIKERPLSQCIWLSSNHLNHTSKKGKLNILRVDPRKSTLAALISHVLCIFISFHYLTYKWCMVKYTGFCSKMVRYVFKSLTSIFLR